MVFLICECGVNWRDLVDADDMIRQAAEAGADACKFQAYKPDFNQYQHPDYQHLNEIALDESKIRYLYWRCQQHGIEFMCTPMYPEAVKMLDPYVKRWKVRFADKGNGYIAREIFKTDKEILISTDKPRGYPDHLMEQIRTLYCIPEYPPVESPAATQFTGFKGYSCHIPTVDEPLHAVMDNDLEYLEVHVRLDKYDPHWCPPDTAVSITMSELRQLCKELGK